MLRRGQTQPFDSRTPFFLFVVSVAVAVLSLATVIQTFALPAEARTTESWYSYTSKVGFDFVAQVQPGQFYTSSVLSPKDLMRGRNGTEPPVFHRVLITRLTDALEIKVPYSYKADRPAEIKGVWSVEGSMTVPGLWQKAHAFAEPRPITVKGAELSGVETINIPIKQLLDEIEAAKVATGLVLEPLEVHLKPTLQLQVDGLPQPVEVLNSPEFRVSLRTSTIEVDDPRESRVEKNLTVTRVIPRVVSFLGSEISIGLLRTVSLWSLFTFLGLAAVLAWLRRTQPDNRTLLQKLGSNLVTVRSFELPDGTAVADVTTARELIGLHVQTEKPVIVVGNVCYLLDGRTCYRLTLDGAEAPGEVFGEGPGATGPGGPEPEVVGPAVLENATDEPGLGPSETDDLTGAVVAEAFTLDPWITEIQVKSVRDLAEIQNTTGRTMIRTRTGYHLLDGSVCFTYRLPEAPLPTTDP